MKKTATLNLRVNPTHLLLFY